MPFPPVQRVLYRKKPLDRVICQLRFPPILRIDTELPTRFQERVRIEFPDFTESSEVTLHIPPEIGEQVPSEILRQVLKSTLAKNYSFATTDRSWQINLTRTFIALTTTSYERWEGFKERLSEPLQALGEIYAPSYFSRVGLRYIDVITRSKVGLPDVPWRELLSPALLGMLGSVNTAASVDSFESVHEIRLEDQGSKARIIAKLNKEKEGLEVTFTIDGDFFDTGQIETQAAIPKLDFFNSHASRLIRWAITERLHQAMEPQPI